MGVSLVVLGRVAFDLPVHDDSPAVENRDRAMAAADEAAGLARYPGDERGMEEPAFRKAPALSRCAGWQ